MNDLDSFISSSNHSKRILHCQVLAYLLFLGLTQIPGQAQIPEAPKVAFVEDPLQFEPGAPKRVPYASTSLVKRGQLGPYPSQARIMGTQGDLIIEVWVDEKGMPTRVTTLWGDAALRLHGEAFVRSHVFKPYLDQGVAIPVRFRMKLFFRLGDGGRAYQVAPKEFNL
ncbi:MAG TPA: energy transducer TonB [Holophagaceae bacterium]|nr:energy transducer TonB [Holophagaceae bacterium]